MRLPFPPTGPRRFWSQAAGRFTSGLGLKLSRRLGRFLGLSMALIAGSPLMIWSGQQVNGQQVSGQQVSGNEASSDVANQPLRAHPLDWVLQYAQEQRRLIRDSIQDYSCRLLKRERIDGQLQPMQYLSVQVRSASDASPLSVFMEYLAPRDLQGRRLLFVQGQHQGKVLVRKGGPSLPYIRLRVDPSGSIASQESKYPITDVGFDRVIDRLVDLIHSDIESDPGGTNTTAEAFKNAKIRQRVCTHVRVTHPHRDDQLQFHTANLYIDDQWRVPIRLVVHDWPRESADLVPTPGSPKDPDAAILEEFTYLDLRLNTGLDDAIFDASRLNSPTSQTPLPR